MKATRIVSLFAAAILMACLVCGTVLASSPTGGTGGVVNPTARPVPTRRPAPTRNPGSIVGTGPTAAPGTGTSGTASSSRARSAYDSGAWMYPAASSTTSSSTSTGVGASPARLTLQPLSASASATVAQQHSGVAASYLASNFSAANGTAFGAAYESAQSALSHLLSTDIKLSGTNGKPTAIEVNVSGVKAGDTAIVVTEYPNGEVETQQVVVANDGVVRFNATGDATVSVYKVAEIAPDQVGQGVTEASISMGGPVGASYATRSAGATAASGDDDAAPAAAAENSSSAPAQNLGVVTLPKTGNANVALPMILLLIASIGALAVSAKAFRRVC